MARTVSVRSNAVQTPCKYRWAKMSFHPFKYLKRKKKRGKYPQCSIIKCLTIGVLFYEGDVWNGKFAKRIISSSIFAIFSLDCRVEKTFASVSHRESVVSFPSNVRYSAFKFRNPNFKGQCIWMTAQMRGIKKGNKMNKNVSLRTKTSLICICSYR